ncbi:MAG: helix-turn-helix transcriptional regulator [Rhizobiaceae bacterium]
MSALNELDRSNIKPDNFLILLKNCLTTYDVFRLLKTVCRVYNYHSFIVLRLPHDSDETLDDLVVVTNWNPELIRGYDAMGFLAGSPAMARLKKSTLPFDWEIQKICKGRPDGKDRSALDLFRQFDFHSGAYFPVTDHLGNRGAVGLSSDSPRVNTDDFAELTLIATHFYERVIKIEMGLDTRREVLTNREIDCLKWAASGKTSAETATILGISENTVNHYMANSATKLDTSNKAHTVAKALRLGILGI